MEELSDEPAECEVTYKKIGCYNENSGDRALSENLFSMRKNINWKPGEWEKFLKRQVFLVKHYSMVCKPERA